MTNAPIRCESCGQDTVFETDDNGLYCETCGHVKARLSQDNSEQVVLPLMDSIARQ